MSWCASHLYFEFNADVLKRLKSHPLFSRGLYLIDTLDHVNWYKPEFEHGLPEDGLIVVRELEQSDCSGQDRLYWHDTSLAAHTFPTLTPNKMFSSVPEAEYLYVEPPIGLLDSVKAIAQASGTSVVYYYHEMWAGGTETEMAWMWSGKERTAIYSDEQTIAIGHEDGSIERTGGCVLDLVLGELGIKLNSGYFALHDRSFRWSAFRQ